ncbi:glycosyltransferase family 2 protein [Vagococcus fluvialis]|uniref:glycosyltransferase family 2 protein n=1 Tax=Vagococcus fluvialis TaxID=2738 RepID=UPI001A8DCD20|nr:glycosyltransferase family A protein [Vagococcus fluvialis]MBO0442880.1 glycosyltransferase family 2 protein [Vagococcus fluvialis]
MTEIKISVVIPTIGHKENLNKSIKSVLKQTYQVAELIIVVDKMQNNTVSFINDVLNTYEGKIRIKVIYNEISVGGSEARNIGIRNSSSEWIALLDDDDYWDSKKIENQVKKIKENNYLEAIYCSHFYRDNGNKKKLYPANKYKDEIDLGYYLFGLKRGRGVGGIQTSSILTTKKIFSEFEFTKGLIKHQDWDWILRAHYIGGYSIIQVNSPDVTYYILENSQNNVSKVNRWRFSEKWIENYKKYISKDAYDGFIQAMVINGILQDQEINNKDRIKIIKLQNKKISTKSKLSLYQIRLIKKYVEVKWKV